MQIKTTLYKQSSKGAIQQWSVFVNRNKITVEYGQKDGKFQTKDTFCKGKNVGKANATTNNEQAVLEAVAKWEKQTKKGYVEDPSGTHLVLLPMKVESYFKNNMKDKVVFPCTIARKLNGLNGEARILDDGTFVQLSRGGENYPLPKAEAVEELKMVMKALGTTSLNYEIYKHGYHLQDIISAVKAPHKHPSLWKVLEYHVFDIPTSTDTWASRWKSLRRLMCISFNYVYIIDNQKIHSHAGIQLFHDTVVAEGYEGSIVRNYKGLYKYNTRTMDVLKVKYAQSEEFLVDSFFIDKNNQPVFWCIAKGGLFKVKPKGTKKQRAEILQDACSWIGKYMTVEFEMYSKDQIPLKPVGIGLREGNIDNGVFTPTE